MRLQSGLGSIEPTGRGDLDNGGKVSLAKVVKVYTDKNTVDVVLVNNNYMGDNEDTEGRISCLRTEPMAGWDDDLKCAYGDITPIHEGQYVYIQYVDAMKTKGVIVASLTPHIKNYNNLPRTQCDKEQFPKERHEKISVSHNQDFSYMNADGEFQKVSSSRAFFIGQKDKVSDARDTEFNYENLAIKNKATDKTIGLKEEQFDFKPFNYLLVTKNQFKDKGATFNRFYHDAEKGITRFTKDDDNKVFYTQLDEDNTFEIRSNLDTNKRDIDAPITGDETLRQSDNLVWNSPKENTVGGDAKNYASIKIKDDGTIVVTRKNNGNSTVVEINERQVLVNNRDTNLVLTDNGVKLKSTKVEIESADITLKGHAKYKDREIAVKGDITTDGATIT